MDLPGVVGQPVVVGTAVFVVANDPAQFGGASVYSFDLNSGLTTWGPVRLPAMNGPVSLAHDNGRLYALNDLGVVWALDAGTGGEIWKVDLDPENEQPSYSDVVAGGGRVYAPSSQNHIRVLDGSSGRHLWDIGGQGPPAVTPEAVWSSNGCGTAYRYDPSTGRQVWRTEVRGCTTGNTPGPTRFYRGRVYVTFGEAMDNLILDAATGALLGTYLAYTAPDFIGDHAYVTKALNVSAIDVVNGSVVWTTKADRMMGSPLTAWQGAIYGVSHAGAVFAIDPASRASALVDELPYPALPLMLLGRDLSWVAAGADTMVATAGGRIVGYKLSAAASPRVPSAPADVQAFPADGRVHVTWSPPAYDGGKLAPVTNYVVRALSTGMEVTVGPTVTGVDVTGLSNGTSQRLTVTAVNRIGRGQPSPPSAPVTPVAGAWSLRPLRQPTGTNFASAVDINNSGMVVGGSDYGSTGRGVVWSPGAMPQLDLGFDEAQSGLSDVNDAGDILGTAYSQLDGLGPCRPCHFLRRGTSNRIVDKLNSVRSVNELGHVAGNFDVDGRDQGVLWRDGEVTPTTGLNVALDVNDQDVVVGQGRGGAARWANGESTALPPAGGFASAVNNSGTIAGIARDERETTRAVRWDENGATFLDSPPGLGPGRPVGINDRGDIVGWTSLGLERRATLWTDGRAINLNTLLAPGTEWVLAHASSINDRGEIVGNGYYRGYLQAFVLTNPHATIDTPHRYVSAVAADRPSGYWRLGEAPGQSVAADASGNGFSGTHRGTRPGVGGALVGDADTATAFPGTAEDQDVLVADRDELDFATSDFSVEAWVKTTANAERTIVAKSSGTGPSWRLTVTDDAGFTGRVRAVIGDGTTERYHYGPAIRVDDGAWHHVVAVFDRDVGTRLYVDGTEAATAGTAPASVSNAAPLRIGDTADYPPFAGDIDEVAVYASALPADRVRAHHGAGRG